jgi:hypothetical protein
MLTAVTTIIGNLMSGAPAGPVVGPAAPGAVPAPAPFTTRAYFALTGPTARYIYIGQAISVATLLLVFILGYVFSIEMMIIIPAVIASLTMFTIWNLADFFPQIAENISCKIPWIGASVKGSAAEIRRIFWPLLTSAMIIAFLAMFVAARGVGFLSINTVAVVAISGLILGYYLFYIKSTSHWAGHIIMVGTALLLISYFWSTPVEVALNYVESISTINSLNVVSKTPNTEYKVNETTGYEIRRGKYIKVQTVAANSEVKVIGSKTHPKSHELYHLVMLKDDDGQYANGKELYIPAKAIINPELEKRAAAEALKKAEADKAQAEKDAAAKLAAAAVPTPAVATKYGEPDKNNIRCLSSSTDTPLEAGIGKTTPYWINPIGKKLGFSATSKNFTVVTERNERFNISNPEDVARLNSSHLGKFYLVNNTNDFVDITTKINEA